MAQLVFTQETREKIVADQVLFGKVAKELGLSIRRLSDLIPSNPPRLATASVLAVLREHLGVTEDSELLEEVSSEDKSKVDA